MASSYDGTRQNIVWYWQSNTNPFSTTEEKNWTKYAPSENECIEEAYTENSNKVDINQNYFIDFKKMLQISKYDPNKQRPVKREKEDIQQQVTIPSSTSASVAPGEKLKFVDKWIKQNNISSHYFNEQNVEEIILLAAKGIETEGRLLGKEDEGINLADKLRKLKSYSLLEVSKTCVYISTLETYLYKIVNKCLREDDMNKINTLGPFCFLLVNALWMLRRNENITLYRGVNLNEELLIDHKAAIGKGFSWKAFTATTRNRQIAERFTNTLFIISVVQMPFKPAYWTPVSEYSEYPSRRGGTFTSCSYLHNQ
ncbi:hypothetical protein I4U23_021957 [Adineta vaga]|nr:hypothetical protein I4U23_021957 [Adineta vaga]